VVAYLVEALRYKLEGGRFDLEFFIDLFLPTALWLWVRRSSYSASNRNEYHECFQGSKGGICVGLTTLPSSCADCLEHPGALMAFPCLYRFFFTCYVLWPSY